MIFFDYLGFGFSVAAFAWAARFPVGDKFAMFAMALAAATALKSVVGVFG